MDRIATMSLRDREQLFRIVADGARSELHMDVSAGVIEKDFWVCWLISKLFGLPETKPVDGEAKLLFKGGTSLSKVFGAIRRFSEDVDISVEPSLLSIDLKPLRSPTVSNSLRKRTADELVAACGRHVREYLRPKLLAALDAVLGKQEWLPERPEQEGQVVLVFPYPQAVDRDVSLLPEVRMEFGARADLHPWTEGNMHSYVWDVRPDVFGDDRERALIAVPTLRAERTFWEKVTLLHVENLRASRTPSPQPRAWERISRHGYDLVMLAREGVADQAIPEELFRRVCDTKHLWYRSGFSDYDGLTRAALQLAPRLALRDRFARDYADMRGMFFVEPPSIEELLGELKALEDRIRQEG